MDCNCTDILYSAALTVLVRTVFELRLHQPTCIGCGVGYDSSIVTIAYRAHLETPFETVAIATTHGKNHSWTKTPRYERWLILSDIYVMMSICYKFSIRCRRG